MQGNREEAGTCTRNISSVWPDVGFPHLTLVDWQHWQMILEARELEKKKKSSFPIAEQTTGSQPIQPTGQIRDGY